MKKYLKTDEWNIIEDSFQADRMRWSESIFSLGNGRFGQRGHFEEPYSSDSYRGAFVAGITFLDKTRVGWWKNGFPQFYTRIPNAPDWSSISLRLIDEELDLAQWDVDSFNRRLDMKAGISYRDAEVTAGKQTPPARGTYRQYGSPQSLPYKVQRYVRQLYRQGFTRAYP